MTSRPMLSKPLAAKIRGAYSCLQDAIVWKIDQDRMILELQEKISAFDGDPVGWSERHYPRHGPNSYPVQTHIIRARESLMRKLAKQQDVAQSLREAEKNLARVEAEVELAAARIRPTTPKESWPDAPEGVEVQRTRIHAEIDQDMRRSRREYERFQQEIVEADERDQARREREDLEARRRHILMGAEHVIIHQMRNRYIKEAYETYKSMPEHGHALGSGWSGGLTSFVMSKRAVQAGEHGIDAAKALIALARRAGRDLWDVCREEGFWTLDDI